MDNNILDRLRNPDDKLLERVGRVIRPALWAGIDMAPDGDLSATRMMVDGEAHDVLRAVVEHFTETGGG